MSFTDRILERLAGHYIDRRLAEATTESDRGWRSLSTRQAELPQSDLHQRQLDSIDAWRSNPVAFRIVELSIDYVLGKSFTFQARPRALDAFLHKWWHHPLNAMDVRLRTMLRELSLTGDLFVTYHTNKLDGMTYIRTIPSTDIMDIVTAPNDQDQEVSYTTRQYDPARSDSGTLAANDVSHFTINQLQGSLHGQGDLWPSLPWLRRYKDWLTDRVIVNKYKSAFLWDVTLTGANAATITRKKNELATPPTPGSVLVHNEAEIWQAVQPNINADSSQADGRALRMMIATGTGTPLHWLGEGAEYNRAVGSLMEEPAKRKLEHRQLITKHILTQIVAEVVSRARATGALPGPSHAYSLDLNFPELTTNDLLAQAQALEAATNALVAAQPANLLADPRARAWLEHFAQLLPTIGDTTTTVAPDSDTTSPTTRAVANAGTQDADKLTSELSL